LIPTIPLLLFILPFDKRIHNKLWKGMNMEIPERNPSSSITVSPSVTDNAIINLKIYTKQFIG